MRHLTALVADRDAGSRAQLCAALAGAGFQLHECDDGTETLRLAMVESPDLIVIGLGLPPPGGLECLRRLRLHSSVPVLTVGDCQDDGTVVRALDLGADDYVVLPCSVEQLLARVRAVLRRLRPTEDGRRQVLVLGDITVDFDLRRVFVEGREVSLSPTEWQLLVELATNMGRLLLHEELLTRAWGPEYRHDRQYLRVWIRRLRRKLEDDGDGPRYIHTVPGLGYMFGPAADPAPSLGGRRADR